MNNKVISLVINILVIVLGVIGVFLIANAMGYSEVVDETTEEVVSDTSAVSSAVTYSVWILGIALAAIALFTIFAIIINPKRFISTAIGILIFGLIVLLGYSMAEVDLTGPMSQVEGATAENQLWGGIGIKTTYILVILAIGLIIIQGARSLTGYIFNK
jgi:uncharacterized membrane protein